MVLPTPEVVKAAFSGNPDKKAGWVSKTEAVNAKFQLNLPVDGTVTDLKDRLKDAKENLLRKATANTPGSQSGAGLSRSGHSNKTPRTPKQSSTSFPGSTSAESSGLSGQTGSSHSIPTKATARTAVASTPSSGQANTLKTTKEVAKMESAKKKQAEKEEQARKKAEEQEAAEVARRFQSLNINTYETEVREVTVKFIRGSKVPGRKGVKVPETSSEGLSILVVNLSINVYQKDCQACVTDEKEVQYKIAMRLHILGYDVWLEEAIQNDFQIGDVEGSGASKRYDIFVAHGNAKVIMEIKKTSGVKTDQVVKYMRLLRKKDKPVNYGTVITFPGEGNPPKWLRMRYAEGVYNPFELRRTDEVVEQHMALLRAHFKEFPIKDV